MFREFQATLTQRLLRWSLFSVLIGLLMLAGKSFWRKVGQQFIAWGLIDGVIAIGGQVLSERRLKRVPADEDPREVIWKEKQFLKLALWGNTFLDFLYVLGGIRWINKRHVDRSQRGHGLGIVIQGLFLLCFDLYHAIQLQQVREPIDE